MQWIADNWLILLLFGGMAAMHLFGHGGHGGHGGGHGGKHKPPPAPEGTAQTEVDSEPSKTDKV